MSEFHVVVFAGGRGTRIKDTIGEKNPKLLANIQGRPYLEYLLNWLKGINPELITLATGHLHEEIEDYISAMGYKNIRLSREKEPLGTFGAA